MRVAQAFLKQWLTHTAQCRFAPVLRPSASAPPVTFVDGCSEAYLVFSVPTRRSWRRLRLSFLTWCAPRVASLSHCARPLAAGHGRRLYGMGGFLWYVGAIVFLSTLCFHSRFLVLISSCLSLSLSVCGVQRTCRHAQKMDCAKLSHDTARAAQDQSWRS